MWPDAFGRLRGSKLQTAWKLNYQVRACPSDPPWHLSGHPHATGGIGVHQGNPHLECRLPARGQLCVTTATPRPLNRKCFHIWMLISPRSRSKPPPHPVSDTSCPILCPPYVSTVRSMRSPPTCPSSWEAHSFTVVCCYRAISAGQSLLPTCSPPFAPRTHLSKYLCM